MYEKWFPKRKLTLLNDLHHWCLNFTRKTPREENVLFTTSTQVNRIIHSIISNISFNIFKNQKHPFTHKGTSLILTYEGFRLFEG